MSKNIIEFKKTKPPKRTIIARVEEQTYLDLCMLSLTSSYLRLSSKEFDIPATAGRVLDVWFENETDVVDEDE